MMRMMQHPNVCALKAYFYNQGEKVGPILFDFVYLYNNGKLEGRDLLKFSLGIRARNSISSSSSLCKDQTTYTHFASQDLHVSTL